MPLPTSATSHHGMQSLFSVEQVELIRRLRNSGITKEQVVHAFESFERIDEDLGMLYSIPKSLAQIQTTPSLYTCQTTAASSSTIDQTLMNEHGRKRRCSDNAEVSDTAVSEEGSDVMANSISRMNSIVEVEGEHDTDIDDVEYVKQNKRSRQQEMISNAMKSGVSSSFFNTFRGDHSKLPEKLQQQMYMWYLKQQGMSPDFYYSQSSESRQLEEQNETCSLQSNESQNSLTESQLLYGPASTRLHHIGSVNQAITSMLSPDEQRQAFMRENAMLMKPDEYADMQYTPRRERFTFREKHLEILEAYFKINQYPINDEREKIANKCNTAMSMSTGRELDDKERVTNQNVQNWFNNRRKEIKKLARAEGLNCSEVSLPSRLKQRSDFPESVEMGDQPSSYEDKNGTERSFNSGGVTKTHNIKSEPCLSDDSHKPQNQPITPPFSSNQRTTNRLSGSTSFTQRVPASISQSQTIPASISQSQTVPASISQSQPNSSTVSQSPMNSTSGKTAHKIKQELFENRTNDVESSA